MSTAYPIERVPLRPRRRSSGPVAPRPRAKGLYASVRKLAQEGQQNDSVWAPTTRNALNAAANAAGKGWYTCRPEVKDGVPGARVWKKGEPE